MHGVGFDEDVRNWFDQTSEEIPKTTISRNKIAKALQLN
jgi:hypothetical protein